MTSASWKNLARSSLLSSNNGCCPNILRSTINLVISSLNGLFAFLGMEPMKLKKLKQQKSNSVENVLTMAEYKKLLMAAKVK